ncbi:hypothetical protein C8R45DRAFT_1019283 [Mycena sanguinolenta]|nr:hypothetical protein C8R45DRAFT_1019283 [Mycena sanguinolenta]
MRWMPVSSASSSSDRKGTDICVVFDVVGFVLRWRVVRGVVFITTVLYLLFCLHSTSRATPDCSTAACYMTHSTSSRSHRCSDRFRRLLLRCLRRLHRLPLCFPRGFCGRLFCCLGDLLYFLLCSFGFPRLLLFLSLLGFLRVGHRFLDAGEELLQACMHFRHLFLLELLQQLCLHLWTRHEPSEASVNHLRVISLELDARRRRDATELGILHGHGFDGWATTQWRGHCDLVQCLVDFITGISVGAWWSRWAIWSREWIGVCRRHR